MNFIVKLFFIILLLSVSVKAVGQNYCIQFSKGRKRNIIIEEGKKISFVIKYNEDWGKGIVTKITTDSLFIEQKKSKKELFSERESNYEIIGYGIKDFRMMAYIKASRVVGESAIVLVAFTIATLTYGGMVFLDSNDESPPKQWFMKNVDFEDGWKAEIVKYE